MRNDRLIPGTVLVIIGVLFLLDNFRVIDFNWFSFIHLWPILLVIAGVNLVFANNRSGVATAIKIGVLIAGMAFLIFNGLGHHRDTDRNSWRYAFRNFDYNDNNDDEDSTDTNISTSGKGSGHYQEAYKPETKQAVLNISGGATSYVIKDITNNLFEANTREYGNHYELTSSIDSGIQTLDFDMNNEHHHGIMLNFGDTKSNQAYLKLNTNPEWEINVEAGAAKINFDLSSFKIQKLKLEGGAASFNVKMGQPLTETNVEVSTGISKVTLSIPQNAACHITTETGVSSKTFNGFQNVGDNEYETPNFDKAATKMYITLSGGISDFKVNRY
jgi:hypothetical protein